jgi:hypothetical protein
MLLTVKLQQNHKSQRERERSCRARFGPLLHRSIRSHCQAGPDLLAPSVDVESRSAAPPPREQQPAAAPPAASSSSTCSSATACALEGSTTPLLLERPWRERRGRAARLRRLEARCSWARELLDGREELRELLPSLRPSSHQIHFTFPIIPLYYDLSILPYYS